MPPRLTVPSKQQYGLGVDGTDIWNMAPYIWSMGGSFTNSKYTTASGYMNSTATQTAVTTLVNLLKAGDIGSDFQGGASAVSGETGFPKNEYAMYIDGPWAVPTYEGESFSGYGIAQFPSGRVDPSRRSVAKTTWSPRTVTTSPTPRSSRSSSTRHSLNLRWPSRATCRLLRVTRPKR